MKSIVPGNSSAHNDQSPREDRIRSALISAKKKVRSHGPHLPISDYNYRPILSTADRPWLELLEEVVALIIDEYECREVFNADFPHSFHTEFWVFYAFD